MEKIREFITELINALAEARKYEISESAVNWHDQNLKEAALKLQIETLRQRSDLLTDPPRGWSQLPDKIRESVRQYQGIEPKDESQDARFAMMTSHEILNSYLEWEGIINYTDSIYDVFLSYYPEVTK